jgi:hypothetical protein
LGAKKNMRVLEGKANVGNQVQTGSLKSDFTWNGKNELFNSEKDMK